MSEYPELSPNDIAIAKIRAIFDTFDWEQDDRQRALEEIERIVS